MHWTPEDIRRLADRMEAKPAEIRVSASTKALIVEALRFYAREGCAEAVRDRGFSIEVWDDRVLSVVEHMAQVAQLTIAHATYEATLLQRPGKVVILRHGIRVVRSNEGGKR